MCRYFVMFKNLVHFGNWVTLSTIGHKRDCNSNKLSLGILQVDKYKNISQQKFIPPPYCFNETIEIDPNALVTFYHMRNAGDGSIHQKTSLTNIHPFVFEDRFIGMHNGNIIFKKGFDTFILPRYLQEIERFDGTPPIDTQYFFAIWLSFYDSIQNMIIAFDQAKAYTKPKSTMNLVLYDKQKNELYIYRNEKITKLTPPVYITPTGFTNFKVPDSKTIPPGKLIVTSVA